MNFLSTIVIAGLLAAGASTAERMPQLVAGPAEGGTITREWTWSEGGAVTTFTATGPAEQVNALDPRNGPLDCEGCLLASSVSFGQ